jgi:hypothetical protein
MGVVWTSSDERGLDIMVEKSHTSKTTKDNLKIPTA